jgi:hypothetical protein
MKGQINQIYLSSRDYFIQTQIKSNYLIFQISFNQNFQMKQKNIYVF